MKSDIEHVKEVRDNLRKALVANAKERSVLRAAARALDGKAKPGRKPRNK